MSLDKSLKGRSTLVRHRNVLTRAERIEWLKELGQWTEDSRPLGLPKVGHRKTNIGKKDKAEKKPEGEQAVEATDEKDEKDKK